MTFHSKPLGSGASLHSGASLYPLLAALSLLSVACSRDTDSSSAELPAASAEPTGSASNTGASNTGASNTGASSTLPGTGSTPTSTSEPSSTGSSSAIPGSTSGGDNGATAGGADAPGAGGAPNGSSSGGAGGANDGGAGGGSANSGAGGEGSNVAEPGDPPGSSGGGANEPDRETNDPDPMENEGSEEPGVRELAPPNATVPNPIVTHVFTADPSAYAFEGRIYVYASHDPDDQMGYDMVDYHVFSSNDLANWQDHGVALDSADIPFASKLYAPDCAYDAALDKYFLYFPDAGSTLGVAESDDPGGPFVNPVQLVTKQTPGVGDVDWLFDPTAFFDDDGQGYLYFGGGPPDTGDNARIIRLNPDRVSLMDDSATTLAVPDFFEASFMFKREGKYYFSYSTTFANHAPTIDYMISDNPMSGFEFVGTVIPNPEGNNGDNNHHSMVEYEGQWYVFYHNRVQANREGYSNYQRSITLDRLSWEGDRMVPVSATRGEVAQLRSVDAFTRIEAELLAGQSGIETDFALEDGERVGVAITDLADGDWIAVSQVDFAQGASQMNARVASTNGGSIEVLQGGCPGFRTAPGTLIGSCAVEATGGYQSWVDVSCSVEAAAGVHDLCLRFRGSGASILNLDYYSFE